MGWDAPYESTRGLDQSVSTHQARRALGWKPRRWWMSWARHSREEPQKGVPEEGFAFFVMETRKYVFEEELSLGGAHLLRNLLLRTPFFGFHVHLQGGAGLTVLNVLLPFLCSP